MRTTLVLTSILVCLTACSSVEMTSDYDHSVDFSKYRTFTWIERDEAQIPKHLDMRLRRVVDEVLSDEKGFEKAPVPPTADLLLAYYVSFHEELEVDYAVHGYYAPYRYGYWPGYGYGAAHVRSYAVGTVVLDIVDRETKQLVWTGWVQRAVNDPNPPSSRIQKTVESLLENFPPQ